MLTYRTDPDKFVEMANVLKALSHPARLCIVKTLYEKQSCNVTSMQNCLGEAQSTVSQHISKLKSANIVIGSRDGNRIYYSLADERIKKMVELFSEEYWANR